MDTKELPPGAWVQGPASKDKKYTVLLLYPDHCTDNFGQDTYMTCAEAPSVKEAIADARQQCINDNKFEDEDPEDFFVIAVIEGDHRDIKDQSETIDIPEDGMPPWRQTPAEAKYGL